MMASSAARIHSARARAILDAEGEDMAVAMPAKKWTLSELHRLPDDGNKYELIRGELFVTPAPTYEHETVIARLDTILVPYVASQRLGYVHHARSVLQYKGSETEPDLMVRMPHPGRKKTWRTAPTPILVVEVHSPSTKRRDLQQKRDYYMDAGVRDYWMIDMEERTVTIVRKDEVGMVVSDKFSWHPLGASAPVEIDVAALFDD
jgi:Uma2 family endonuclease